VARRAKKKPTDYPDHILFDENLEGAAEAFAGAGLNLPGIFVAAKGTRDHDLAMNIGDALFITGDTGWLKRQPPYDHAGIVVLDTGNLPMKEKAEALTGFFYVFHIKHKRLHELRSRRFRLTKTTLSEILLEGEPRKIW
jgi:hypothetical protein